MKVILDATIIGKWFLAEENYVQQAFSFFFDFKQGNISLIEPYLLSFEFNNLINLATKRKRIAEKESLIAIKNFNLLPFVFYDISSNLNDVLKIALENNISSYDASYICLSEILNIPFFTADEKLIKNVKENYKRIRFITDY